jgi:hypothetical protein
MKKLPPQQLHDPHTAVYAAVLLLDDNQAEAAREYLEAARRGPIFAEERKLLDESLSKQNPATPASSVSPPASPPPAGSAAPARPSPASPPSTPPPPSPSPAAP